jgi:hypothetical protein
VRIDLDPLAQLLHIDPLVLDVAAIVPNPLRHLGRNPYPTGTGTPGTFTFTKPR